MTSKVDLHSHTLGSDGRSTPDEIAKAAAKAGLRALCLTDHHSSMTPECAKVAEALRGAGVIPIIGAEYSTKNGHLLVYGVDVPVDAWGRYPKMQDVIDDVNRLGGACVVPHPYKGYQRALKDDLLLITGLAGIESLNGQVELEYSDNNRRARDAAKKMGVPRTGASDAHNANLIGLTYTLFDDEINSEEDFLRALKAGAFKAMRDEVMWKERQTRRNTQSSWVPPPPDAYLDGIIDRHSSSSSVTTWRGPDESRYSTTMANPGARDAAWEQWFNDGTQAPVSRQLASPKPQRSFGDFQKDKREREQFQKDREDAQKRMEAVGATKVKPVLIRREEADAELRAALDEIEHAEDVLADDLPLPDFDDTDVLGSPWEDSLDDGIEDFEVDEETGEVVVLHSRR